MKLKFSKLSDQEKRDLVMMHYCCTGDGLSDSQYDNSTFRVGDKKVSAQEARAIELDITKEECVELMKTMRLATGVMPLVPSKFYDDAEFLHALAKAYGGAVQYIYSKASDDLRNDPNFIMPIIEKLCGAGSIKQETFDDVVGIDLKNNEKFIRALINNPNLNCEWLLSDILTPPVHRTKGVLEVNPITMNTKLMVECVSADSSLYEGLLKLPNNVCSDENVMMAAIISTMNQSGPYRVAQIASKMEQNIDSCEKHKKNIQKIANASKKYLAASKNGNLVSKVEIKYYEASMRKFISSIEEKLAAEVKLQAEANNNISQ